MARKKSSTRPPNRKGKSARRRPYKLTVGNKPKPSTISKRPKKAPKSNFPKRPPASKLPRKLIRSERREYDERLARRLKSLGIAIPKKRGGGKGLSERQRKFVRKKGRELSGVMDQRAYWFVRYPKGTKEAEKERIRGKAKSAGFTATEKGIFVRKEGAYFKRQPKLSVDKKTGIPSVKQYAAVKIKDKRGRTMTVYRKRETLIAAPDDLQTARTDLKERINDFAQSNGALQGNDRIAFRIFPEQYMGHTTFKDFKAIDAFINRYVESMTVGRQVMALNSITLEIIDKSELQLSGRYDTFDKFLEEQEAQRKKRLRRAARNRRRMGRRPK